MKLKRDGDVWSLDAAWTLKGAPMNVVCFLLGAACGCVLLIVLQTLL